MVIFYVLFSLLVTLLGCCAPSDSDIKEMQNALYDGLSALVVTEGLKLQGRQFNSSRRVFPNVDFSRMSPEWSDKLQKRLAELGLFDLSGRDAEFIHEALMELLIGFEKAAPHAFTKELPVIKTCFGIVMGSREEEYWPGLVELVTSSNIYLFHHLLAILINNVISKRDIEKAMDLFRNHSCEKYFDRLTLFKQVKPVMLKWDEEALEAGEMEKVIMSLRAEKNAHVIFYDNSVGGKFDAVFERYFDEVSSIMHPHKYAYLMKADIAPRKLVIFVKLFTTYLRLGRYMHPICLDEKDYVDANEFFGQKLVALPELLRFEVGRVVESVEPFFSNMKLFYDHLDILPDEYNEALRLSEEAYIQFTRHTFFFIGKEYVKPRGTYMLDNSFRFFLWRVNIDGYLGIIRGQAKICILLGWFEEDADFLNAVMNLRQLKTINDTVKKLFIKYAPKDFGPLTSASCNIVDDNIFDNATIQ